MTPFQILGVPVNCSVDEAKKAYRSLAQQHHPDKGGVEAKFKEIKTAWEQIEAGYRWSEPPKSTFSPPPSAAPKQPEKPRTATAGKPAPGFEARKTRPVLPHTTLEKRHGVTETVVTVDITSQQAFMGCTIPFWDSGVVRDFVVHPRNSYEKILEGWSEGVRYPLDEMIGRSVGDKLIVVSVRIDHVAPAPKAAPQPEDDDEQRDAELSLPLCALGLFTGGRVTVNDPRDVPIQITIPAGYNPIEPFIYPQRGYGKLGARGRLTVKIVPVFKAPSALNDHELLQLKRMTEMVTNR